MTILILAFLVCVALCYIVAKKRNADAIYWTLMGLLLGPLAVPFVFFSKPQTNHERTNRQL